MLSSRGEAMRFKTLTAAGVAAAAGLFLAITVAAQAQDTYKTKLYPVPSDQKTRPQLAGTATISATLSGNKLSVNGTFEGLLSPATKAEVRAGVLAGVRGPVVGELMVTKATRGSISGSVDLTPQQVATLKKGGIYIQLYSEKTPEG